MALPLCEKLQRRVDVYFVNKNENNYSFSNKTIEKSRKRGGKYETVTKIYEKFKKDIDKSGG
jgi:hypothetical protein